jgi:hypothetical protein
MSNVHGFGNVEKKDDKKKKPESYIGGNKSGLAVQDKDDDVASLIDMAKQ